MSSSRLALRVARPLWAATSSAQSGATSAAASSAAQAAKPSIPSADDPAFWPSQPSGANATTEDGRRVRKSPTTAFERTPGAFETNRNAHLRAPPAFPALQPFFKVAHVGAVVLLVGLTLVTGFETIRSLVTVRSRRLAWEREHPEEHAKLLADIAAKKAEASAVQQVKYAASAIDPENDEKRRQEAEALRQAVKAPAK